MFIDGVLSVSLWTSVQIGNAHPHYVLLDKEGIVSAIGADRTACMVNFNVGKLHKLLIGRGGSFQLAVLTKGHLCELWCRCLWSS